MRLIFVGKNAGIARKNAKNAELCGKCDYAELCGKMQKKADRIIFQSRGKKKRSIRLTIEKMRQICGKCGNMPKNADHVIPFPPAPGWAEPLGGGGPHAPKMQGPKN